MNNYQDITHQEIVDWCKTENNNNFIHVVISQTLEGIKEMMLGDIMPHVATAKQIMKEVAKVDRRTVYMFQMPNLQSEVKMNNFAAGIERIKDGVVTVNYRNCRFDRPHVFIFAQEVPPFLPNSYKWKLYRLVK